MRVTGKLDYLELQAADGRLDSMKAFYASVFGWSFTDYGAAYSAFDEGLEGGFDSDAERGKPPLPVIYSDDLDATFAAVEASGATIVNPIFAFPGGRRFHFADPAGNELAVWGA